jgi:GNAT superfamily N-acetyltransferase
MQITQPIASASHPSDYSDPPVDCAVAQEFLTVHRLSKHFRAALRDHFSHLSADDLFLRFGAHCRPEIINAYVDGIDFRESIVLGVFNDDLELIGVAHLGSDEGGLELGLSVLAGYREHGVGTLLLRRAMQHARAAGADRIFVHCLSINHTLMHLVRQVGASVVESGGEADGVIALPPTKPLDSWLNLIEDQISLYDFARKAQATIVKRLVQQLS